MNELTNSARDVTFLNDEIQQATKGYLKELKEIQNKFIELNNTYPNIIDDYLKYMDFKDEEDMFKIGINKFFEKDTEQYKEYEKNTLIFNRKAIYPEFKLQHFISSINNYK